MRKPENRCLRIERIRHVCTGILGSANTTGSLSHVSLFGPDLSSRLARPSRAQESRGSVKRLLFSMVFLELFGAVEKSNGTVPFGGLVIRDDCRR